MTTKADPNIATRDDVLDLAGGKFFQRGVNYFYDGAVDNLLEAGNTIHATVAGTHEYRVSISTGKQFHYDCNCPVGQKGLFCKHLVATALSWLDQQNQSTSTSTPTSTPTITKKTSQSTQPNKPDENADPINTIRDYLADTSRRQKTEIIIEQAINDPSFRNQMLAKALRCQTLIDIDSQKAFIRSALQTKEFIIYPGMARYIERACPAIDLLDNMLQDGHAIQVAELADYAMHIGFSAYEKVDDSNGDLGDILYNIGMLLFDANTQSNPDAKQLAETLFVLEMKDDWGFIRFEQYDKQLGALGFNRFKQLAEKVWQKIWRKKTNNNDSLEPSGKHQITQLMERIALFEDNIDALIAIKKRDLSCAYHYLEIAEIYTKAKRHDEALDWAEKGAKKYKNNPDLQLNEFLIKRYQRQKQHSKAIDLAWQQFIYSPDLEEYQLVKTCADKTKAWKTWRKKIIQWIHKQYLPQNKKKKNKYWQYQSQGHTLLVEIYLWEKDIDAALKASKLGNCGKELWFLLAKACEKSHPADALKIYQNQIGDLINLKNNSAYDEAATMLRTIKKLMRKLKQQKIFGEYIESMRKDHKQKRNFIKRIEKL